VAVAASARQLAFVNPFLAVKARPLVVGHRGVPTLHQENTLAGFRRAAALGLDAIELDVRITRDGRAVVFHDATTTRLTGVRHAIADLSWDEVAALRVQTVIESGRRFVRYDREERVPLLAEVLAEVGDRIAINIELKPRWFDDDIAWIVASEIRAARAADRVLVTSFDPRRLREVTRLDPAISVGYAWSGSLFGLGRRVPEGMSAIGADHTMIDASSVRLLRRAGVAVGAHVLFPLDGRPREAMADAELDRLLALGLDWLEADDPERLRQLIARR
jgi:glycerophosphoryl diester phosphodiesterase